MATRERTCSADVVEDPRGRVLVLVPFDPDLEWGPKTSHRVGGTVDGLRVRAVLEPFEGGHAFVLGPAWRRDCSIAPGDSVQVVLVPEGPQREDLAEDFAEALSLEPEAGEFFDSLAQFYRKAYLRWIDATKRRPELRAERIDEVVALLKAGEKQRPKT